MVFEQGVAPNFQRGLPCGPRRLGASGSNVSGGRVSRCLASPSGPLPKSSGVPTTHSWPSLGPATSASRCCQEFLGLSPSTVNCRFVDLSQPPAPLPLGQPSLGFSGAADTAPAWGSSPAPSSAGCSNSALPTLPGPLFARPVWDLTVEPWAHSGLPSASLAQPQRQSQRFSLGFVGGGAPGRRGGAEETDKQRGASRGRHKCTRVELRLQSFLCLPGRAALGGWARPLGAWKQFPGEEAGSR